MTATGTHKNRTSRRIVDNSSANSIPKRSKVVSLPRIVWRVWLFHLADEPINSPQIAVWPCVESCTMEATVPRAAHPIG